MDGIWAFEVGQAAPLTVQTHGFSSLESTGQRVISQLDLVFSIQLISDESRCIDYSSLFNNLFLLIG